MLIMHDFSFTFLSIAVAKFHGDRVLWFLQSIIQACDQRVHDHQGYQDNYQVAQEWLSTIKDRLSVCDDPAGDKHTIQNKLDRLQVCSFNSL